jgi:hypothetical protein
VNKNIDRKNYVDYNCAELKRPGCPVADALRLRMGAGSDCLMNERPSWPYVFSHAQRRLRKDDRTAMKRLPPVKSVRKGIKEADVWKLRKR